jgi:hypothetical protein
MVGEDEGEFLRAHVTMVKGLDHLVGQRDAEPQELADLPQHLDPRPVAAPRAIRRIGEGRRQHAVARKPYAAHIDLRLRDRAGEMEPQRKPRIGPFAGSGGGRKPADPARQRRDVARQRGIAPDRPAEPVAKPVLRNARLAGRAAGAGALRRIGAVGGALRGAGRAGLVPGRGGGRFGSRGLRHDRLSGGCRQPDGSLY